MLRIPFMKRPSLFSGTYRPFGDMGILNNGQNPNGLWQLIILDYLRFCRCRRTVQLEHHIWQPALHPFPVRVERPPDCKNQYRRPAHSQRAQNRRPNGADRQWARRAQLPGPDQFCFFRAGRGGTARQPRPGIAQKVVPPRNARFARRGFGCCAARHGQKRAITCSAPIFPIKP